MLSDGGGEVVLLQLTSPSAQATVHT